MSLYKKAWNSCYPFHCLGLRIARYGKTSNAEAHADMKIAPCNKWKQMLSYQRDIYHCHVPAISVKLRSSSSQEQSVK